MPLIDIEKIRQLIDMMVANDLMEVSLRNGDVEMCLRRPQHPTVEAGRVVTSPGTPFYPVEGTGTAGGSRSPDVDPSEEPDRELIEIKSPMVGTFYAGPDPESPPFVQVSSRVGAGTVLCLLEAMKVFSEIKADVAGTIERILAKSAEAVEYGQPLFLLRPA